MVTYRDSNSKIFTGFKTNHAGKHMNKRTDGFTLVELLTTVLVSAIILSYAIPSFLDFVEKTSTRTAAEDLLESFRNARLTAIEQKAYVVVCHSKTGAGCDGTWDDGYLVFNDKNDNGAYDSGEEIISFQRFKDSLTIKVASATNNYKVYFDQNGWTSGSANSLLICAKPGTNKNGYQLVINRAGRIRVEDSSEDWNGHSC